ncbi:hypothetical protein UFOVP1254_48 [uncultured Caudovirales phage]|uniref:Uncharacterized protein n=1 Tax=uncultured Caudovirales phage TaxID=2100421 RepID=A0A6J5RRF1_9CAUD|nr:hypothetical protein UFOVP1254_48 [uncultured Caudovirales phage]
MNFQLNFKSANQLSLIPVPPSLTAKQIDDYLSVICSERILWTTEGIVVYKSREEKVILDLLHAVSFYHKVAAATRP